MAPRPAGGDVEDGYLFGYGQDYQGALRQLAQLTGPAPMLPSYLFGVWFSRYYPYTTADYEQQLIPAFRANQVPLDTLSVDTDWKAPNTWNGWEWNPALFPDPQTFLTWAKSQGIHVTLNIHSGISTSDPQLAQAEAVAGNSLASANCFSGPCQVWDWSQIPQAESNFSLQQSFEQQGTAFWWLDWCCDNSSVSMPGLTPDSWINHLYTQEMLNQGERGFVLARIGSSYQSPGQVYAAGPWSDHRSAVHFTGDTWGTWNTLASQAELSQAEASVGQPYVSDDIGSFLGPPPGGDTNPADLHDTPDLYDRWVQLGAFQPILRLHSSHGDRLPWDYPQPVQSITENFLRLREALVPYTYTLAVRKLAAPQGWAAVPVAPAPGTLGPGQSATVSWTVTAPSGSTGTLTAALQATVSYTSQATGSPGSVTAAEQPAPPAPPPAPPSITSVTPASGAAGTVETIAGSGFGSSPSSTSYLTLADQGTSWGAPYDAASLQISSWSDTKIVFTLPAPSGTNGIWHLVPGTTATVTVTTPAGTSGTGNISITGSP